MRAAANRKTTTTVFAFVAGVAPKRGARSPAPSPYSAGRTVAATAANTPTTTRARPSADAGAAGAHRIATLPSGAQEGKRDSEG